MTERVRFDEAVRDYDGDRVVGPVDLVARAGECVALVGPNGCGKSTALRMASGVEHPDSGTILVLGRPPAPGAADFRRRVAVLDETSYFPDLTVREHLEIVAVGHGLGVDAPERVDEALEHCRLSGHADVAPGKLSQGLRQLMSIASILLPPRTEVLLLDEPERHLDERARTWLVEVLSGLRTEGACLLVATHHRPLVRALADRVYDYAEEAG